MADPETPIPPVATDESEDDRRAFRGEAYWARPLPAFGDPRPRILLVGLAPAAHGGNRTGRMFTGDASGDFLFRALHAVGLANQPESRRAGDGLALSEVLITAAVRCAPPDNRPLPEEFAFCREYLDRERDALPGARVMVALGSLAFDASLGSLARSGIPLPRPKPRFAHGAEFEIGGYRLFATYHPSQQNTFTGKLTQDMLQAVLARAKRSAAPEDSGVSAPAYVPAEKLLRGPGRPRSSRSRAPRPPSR
ncbi:MAG: uracil-DNA glycosylase [Acidobacteria bacterium]|nr:uracil-DNA glycosylase [Acidobacteriota bacterium]